MIAKTVTVVLTPEEIKSPEPIQIKLNIVEAGSEEMITYTVDLPKESDTDGRQTEST